MIGIMIGVIQKRKNFTASPVESGAWVDSEAWVDTDEWVEE